MGISKLRQSPSQTLGPFFAYGLTPGQYGYAHSSLVTPDTTSEDTEGERIRIIGQVFDGKGQPINDAMVEIWQADAHGRYPEPAGASRDNAIDPSFRGLGRSGTGADSRMRFQFDTIKPGVIGEGQAPHLNVILTMRGLFNHLFTRLYFDDEVDANAKDPVLALIPEGRARTLLARHQPGAAAGLYRFDIHMQGPDETVFFDI